MTNTNTVWAATIHCPTVPGTNQCIGTSFPDDMLGTSKDDDMDGYIGNDKMFGFAGNDKMTGSLDSDTMSGGSGDDNMDGDVRLAAKRMTISMAIQVMIQYRDLVALIYLKAVLEMIKSSILLVT